MEGGWVITAGAGSRDFLDDVALRRFDFAFLAATAFFLTLVLAFVLAFVFLRFDLITRLALRMMALPGNDRHSSRWALRRTRAFRRPASACLMAPDEALTAVWAA